MAIVSFKHRFIFIKTRKTAGTSIEVHLAALCGSEDIVTPIYPANAAHRPRNFETVNGPGYFNHMSACAIQNLQPDIFGSFFKFCFERHPVDKCLSHFAMLKNSPFHYDPDYPTTWEEYLDRGDFPVDIQKYVDPAGQLMVNKIYRYEEIDSAMKQISIITGIPDSPLLAKEKNGFRHGVPTFEQVMADPGQRDRISEAFELSLRITPYDC